MKLRSPWLLLFLSLCLSAPLAYAVSLDKSTLAGVWDYTTYTLLQKGKPAGTIQFKPRSMLFTYREDGTWEMEANDTTHTRMNGSYAVHGNELILKKADGSLYQDFEVELKNDGKAMNLKDKKSIITANKVQTAP
jgi:hypothetical protein